MRKILFLIAFIFVMTGVVYASTVTLYSDAALDGYVVDTGTVVTNGDDGAGDGSANQIYRGFVSFDLGFLTVAGMTIDAAILKMHQSSVTGTPYTDLGDVIVDHLNYGSTLDVGDFNLAALQSNIGTLSANADLEWKTLDVTSFVQDDINNGRERSQYRLRFSPNETDNNSDSDWAWFESADNVFGKDNLPELIIIYSQLSMDDNAYGNAALAYWQASPDELSTLIIIQNTNTTAGRYIQYRIRGECSTNQIYNGCIDLTPGDSIPLWIHVSGGNLILTNNEAGADIATLVTGVTDEMRGYLELTCWITACCTGLAGNNMAVRTVLMGTDWWVGINAAMVQDWADTGANTCVVDDEELPTFDTYWGRYWSDTTTHGRLITVFPGGFDASCQCSISGHGWDEGGNNVPYSKMVKEVAKTPIGPYEGISPSIDIPTDATAGAIEITGITKPMFGFMLMEDPSGKADALPLFK